MDKLTRLKTIAQLAKSAAEIAADIAAITSDAAGHYTAPTAHPSGTREMENLIVGSLMPCEQRLEALQSLLRAVHALHQTEGV